MLTNMFLKFYLGISLLSGTLITAAGIEAVLGIDTPIELSEKTQTIIAKKLQLIDGGYTNDVDQQVRSITNALLQPAADVVATPVEMDEMIKAHLISELYYAYNTKWSSNKTRKHRITYDFLSKLDKAERTATQMGQITTFTVISIAAQEFFWNEKSETIDLKNRVRRELRYGLFKKAGHKLDIRNLVFLEGKNLEEIINASITGELRGNLAELLDKFNKKTIGSTYSALLDSITERFTDNSVGAIGDVPLSISKEILKKFGFKNDSLTVLTAKSEGDGMCGEHSFFIPTDGALLGISEGNGRDKILDAIYNNPEDSEAKDLYLQTSKYMGGENFIKLITTQIAKIRETSYDEADILQGKFEHYKKFAEEIRSEAKEQINASRIDLIKRTAQLPRLKDALRTFNTIMNTPELLTTLLSNENSTRILKNILSEVTGLRTINVQLDGLLAGIEAQIAQINLDAPTAKDRAAAALKKETELRITLMAFYAKNQELTREFVRLKREIKNSKEAAKNKALEALEALKKKDEALFIVLDKLNDEAEQLAAIIREGDVSALNKYLLIGATLIDFMNENMLPESGHENAFKLEDIAKRLSFITDFCQNICELVQDEATKGSIKNLMDEFQRVPELMNARINNGLSSKSLEIVKSLRIVPDEIKPEALKTEMVSLALGEGELRGCLPCDAVYTQLWAILHNVNVFVFSGNEDGMTPPLDVIYRLKDMPYNQKTVTYPFGTDGQNLATVILTSPSAKNIFINKKPGHYDKFIQLGDLQDMAAQIRHLNWMGLDIKEKYGAYPL